jgi:hypothetical protein
MLCSPRTERGGGVMAGFVQIIEMQTSRFDEVEALGNDIRDRLDDGLTTLR